ncbi:unnamed protein product [Adineta steineri]|uniref:Uncharacterized protein n=1 Tax=Adineta steineri TaxID=433720 RepID=A0A815UD29_9BILA|nr:unnamed protein product [Adineta steineri]CAF1514191.1 unnamed protein product [Adineta steineri]CAF1596355.1 unnamed protein product [Adineta steineri]CAF1596408.1 unnamed protein product [Adineta steineri]
MDSLLIPPTPYTPLSSSDDNNNPVLVSRKKRILIGCLIGSTLTILLIISIKLVLSMESPASYKTTTTTITTIMLNQSPINSRTTTPPTVTLNQLPTTSTNTVSLSLKSCPIRGENARWIKPGISFINPLGRCLSNENGLCQPRDLFIDDIHDTLYVADSKNNRIQKYSLTETYNSEIGATGITVATKGLLFPQSVFVDIRTEDMYIMDFDQEQTYYPQNSVSYQVHLWKKNDNVGRILLSEVGESLFGGGFHCFTLDKQMNIYVGTRFFIKKWLVSTNYTKNIIVAGHDGQDAWASTSLNDPVAFFITDDLTLYIADGVGKRIQKWTVNATEGTTVIGNLTSIGGITMDCNGYLYYTQALYSVYQLNMLTNQSQMIVSGKNSRIYYLQPGAIKIDKFGNLFFIVENQIHKFSIIKKKNI